MNMLPPSLPVLKHLLCYVAVDGLVGYACGRLNQTNPNLVASIFAIRCLANTLFYHIANYTFFKINSITDALFHNVDTSFDKSLQSQKIFLVTSTLVNMTFLIALRELNLIGHLFSCLLGLATLGYLINRVRYIQDKERPSVAVNPT